MGGEGLITPASSDTQDFAWKIKKNKPKMAYSRDPPKMAVWNYGLKLQ